MDNGTSAFPPSLRPETPEPLTTGTTTVIIILPEGLSGEILNVRVDGLDSNGVVTSGLEAVTVAAKSIVLARVELGEAAHWVSSLSVTNES